MGCKKQPLLGVRTKVLLDGSCRRVNSSLVRCHESVRQSVLLLKSWKYLKTSYSSVFTQRCCYGNQERGALTVTLVAGDLTVLECWWLMVLRPQSPGD